MKKAPFYFVLFFVLTLVNFSCNKQNDLLPSPKASNGKELRLPTVSGDLLSFEDQDQLNYYASLQKEHFNKSQKFDKINGFISMYDEMKRIDINDDQIISKIKEGMYKDMFYINLENAAENTYKVREVVDDISFQTILNSKGMVKIGSKVYRVTHDYLFEISNDNYEKNKLEFQRNPSLISSVVKTKVDHQKEFVSRVDGGKNARLLGGGGEQTYYDASTNSTYKMSAYISVSNWLIYKSNTFKAVHEYKKTNWLGSFWREEAIATISCSGYANIFEAGLGPYYKNISGSVSNNSCYSKFLSEVANISLSSEVYGSVTFNRYNGVVVSFGIG